MAAPLSEQLGLDGLEPRVGQAVPEDPPHEREQVEMTRQWRRRTPVQPESCNEQWPVEASSVVGNQPSARGEQLGEGVEHPGLAGLVGQQELDLPELITVPPAEPDQERDGPGAGRQPGRFGVEAD